MSSSSSSEKITYHLTNFKPSSSSSSNSIQESIDCNESADDIIELSDDDHDEDTGPMADTSVVKRNIKYTDFSNLLKNGIFRAKFSKVLGEHRDDLIQNAGDHEKVEEISKELTSTLTRIDNFDDKAEIKRIKMILYIIMEMCVDPDGNNLGVFVAPNSFRLQKEIYNYFFLPYVKSLSEDHPHSNSQQCTKVKSKKFGYAQSASLARLITTGVKFVMVSAEGKLLKTLQKIALDAKNDRVDETVEPNIDETELNNIVTLVQEEAARIFPDQKIFQVGAYRKKTDSKQLIEMIKQISTDDSITIQNINSVCGVSPNNLFYMKMRVIKGDEQDQLELIFDPNSSLAYDLTVKLKPLLEAGVIIDVKQLLLASIYDSFRLNINYEVHFNNKNEYIPIAMDGSCSIRALYVCYCIYFRIGDNNYEDCNFYDSKQYNHFITIMDHIAEKIIDNIEVHTNFMELYNLVRSKVDIIHLKSTTGKRKSVKTIYFEKEFWLSDYDVTIILKLLECKVAVFVNQVYNKGYEDWALLEAITYPFSKGNLGMNIDFILEVEECPVHLILTQSHFYVSKQKLNLTNLVSDRMDILCRDLISESKSNVNEESIGKNTDKSQVNPDELLRMELLSLYSFIKLKKNKNAPYDGPGELNGIGGIPTLGGMIKILMNLKDACRNIPDDKRFCLEFGSATGFSSVIYFTILLQYKVWGHEVNQYSYHNSLTLQSYLKSNKYLKDIKEYLNCNKLITHDSESMAELRFLDEVILKDIGTKLCFNFTPNQHDTKILLNKSCNWRTSITIIYAYCSGINEDDIAYNVEKVWNEISSLQFIITTVPLSSEEKLYDFGFTGKVELVSTDVTKMQNSPGTKSIFLFKVTSSPVIIIDNTISSDATIESFEGLFNENIDMKLKASENNLFKKRVTGSHINRYSPDDFKTGVKRKISNEDKAGNAIKFIKTVVIPPASKQMIDKSQTFLHSLDDFVKNSVQTMNVTGLTPIHIHRYLQDKLNKYSKPTNK